MAIIKCKMCGGELNIMGAVNVAECEYCGSIQTVPTADNEKKMTLFARANRLRLACEFDKAAGVYESIVAEFPEEAEAYWGLVLCKYGIEYVDDPATGKKIPTCHRSSFDNVMDDPDLDLALEYTDATARRIYREEAKTIEQIRRGIVQVSANEDPYDIFICYKETDPEGNRTLDSVLAQDIYDALADKGYRTFFARISLEDKLGQEYEPYIFSALNSAKIMLAVGTDYEYFNAVWVKNEWSRFLKLMTVDKSKHLIPCFKGIDAYDMPREFARLQAQDLGKVGAIQDLLRGIGKLLGASVPEPAKSIPAPQETPAVDPNIANFLKRGNMALEDENWDDAKRYFDQIMDLDPEVGAVYWGYAVIDVQGDMKRLACENIDGDKRNVRRARQFADRRTAEALAVLDKLITEEKHRRAEEERQQEAEKQSHRYKIRKYSTFQQMVAIDENSSIALRSNGTVAYAGNNHQIYKELSRWTDIVSVAAGGSFVAGLRSDGSVVTRFDVHYVSDTVAKWSDVVSIATGSDYLAGLRADGTVEIACFRGKRSFNVSNWTNIVSIACSDNHIVGVRADGTVVAASSNACGQCNVDEWTNIVAVAAGRHHTVGLRSNGTVVATGLINNGQCDVDDWTDIVAVAAAWAHTVGLRADGTLLAVGSNVFGQCNVDDWSDFVIIAAGSDHTMGVRSDGTVAVVGWNNANQCGISGVKLFKSFETLEQEQEEMKRQCEMKISQNRAEKIASLKAEKASIEADLPNIKGVFAENKRTKLKTRLAEIEKELSKLS